MEQANGLYLGDLAKLRKATVSFGTSVRLSVYVSISVKRLDPPQDEFSWFYTAAFSRKKKRNLNFIKI
jgi:hypothetical protein